MSTTTTSFYVTGGTLQRDAPSYVERQADRDLYESLSRGEFSYVLTSRQMGKSSLMVHTAAQLQREGTAVTVRALTRPAFTSEWAKAGLMARESLEPGARNACLLTNSGHGLAFQRRPTANDATISQVVLPDRSLKLPIVLRLTRRGDTMTPEYSQDNGKSFQPAGNPIQFRPGLTKRMYLGLASTAHDASQVTEAKFDGLEVQQR